MVDVRLLLILCSTINVQLSSLMIKLFKLINMNKEETIT